MAERTKETEFKDGTKVPVKYCHGCEKRMHPKRWANGRLESENQFRRRKYHGFDCMSKDRAVIPDSEKHHKNIVALYTEQGLSTHEIGDIYGCLSGSIHRMLLRRGVELRSRGERHPNRVTKYFHSHGYVKVGDRYEHRIVAEEKLGRPLKTGEVVHHKNGDKSDNHPDNLEVLPSHREHMRRHHSD